MILKTNLTVVCASAPDSHGLARIKFWMRHPAGPDESGLIIYDDQLGSTLQLPTDPRELLGATLPLTFTSHQLLTIGSLFDPRSARIFDLFVDWARGWKEIVVSYHPQLQHQRTVHRLICLRSDPLLGAGSHLRFIIHLGERHFRRLQTLPPGPVFELTL